MNPTVQFQGFQFEVIDRFADGTVWIRDPFSHTELVVPYAEVHPV